MIKKKQRGYFEHAKSNAQSFGRHEHQSLCLISMSYFLKREKAQKSVPKFKVKQRHAKKSLLQPIRCPNYN